MTSTRSSSAYVDVLSWAKNHWNWSRWPALDGSVMTGDTTLVRPPSRSFADGDDPAASPVMKAYRPDGTWSGCFRPDAVVVGDGSPRCHAPAVAVSLPSGL